MVGLIVALVILGILLVISTALFIVSIITKEWVALIFVSILIITLGAIENYVISEINNIPPEPTALDVYRGLTELEITSVNGVPKDTVVVFKNR